MNQTTGLANATIYQAFLQAYQQNRSANFSRWGLNNAQADYFFGYALEFGLLQMVTVLQTQYGPTGGLILTQSVRDWVFNCNRFLLDLLIPNAPACSILVNHSVFSNITIYSGKDNISQINQYINWQGAPVVRGVWKGDLAVAGATELGQFAPFGTKGTNVQVFDDNFVRTLTVKYNTTDSVSGISTYQYVLDYNETFGVNQFFFQSTRGLANLTSVRQSTIFLSLWDMLYVNNTIRNQVIGQNDSTTEFESSTIIDVEPITGNSVRARKRAQVNLFIPGNCSWCNNAGSSFGNTDITPNTYFPIAKVGEYVTIGDDLASLLRSKLSLMDEATNLGFIIGISVGVGLSILGLVLIARGWCIRRKSGYKTINDDDD